MGDGRTDDITISVKPIFLKICSKNLKTVNYLALKTLKQKHVHAKIQIGQIFEKKLRKIKKLKRHSDISKIKYADL
jgi:hypothetical protein